MSSANKTTNNRNRKYDRRRKLVAVIALILAALMVLTLAVSMAYADVNDSSASSESTGNTGMEAVPIEAVNDSSSNEAGTEDTINAAGGPCTSLQKGSVYIDNIDVTGMTEAEAQAAVDARIAQLAASPIILTAGEKSVTVTAGDLGLRYDNTDVVKEALSIGTKGNILKRFMADQYVTCNGAIVIDLDLKVSGEAVRQVVENQAQSLNCDPVNTGLTLDGVGNFYVTPATDGVAVKNEQSVTKIMDYMDHQWHGGQGTVTLAADLTPGQDRSEELSQVTNLLGTCTTYYSINGARDVNITLATAACDGLVLYPGEEYNADTVIGPTTEAEGYKVGTAYADGEIVDAYGGGVCQVSSTLYGAVLQAELQVEERHNHSYQVTYVDPSMDAALSDTGMNFRFVNNTSAPIYIQGVAADGAVTFNIYGQEYRPANRTVEYVYKTGESKEYETEYKTDTKSEVGSIKVSGGVNSLDAELYKQVYVDGVLESEDRVNSSYYEQLPLTYKIGVKDAEPAMLEAINAGINAKNLDQIKAAIAGQTYTAPESSDAGDENTTEEQ